MNKELLLKVADAIEANPEHFYMGDWVSPCATAACIGGWALFLANGKQDFESFINGAIDVDEIKSVLDLPLGNYRFTDTLFYTDDWLRTDLKRKYKESAKSITKAKAAAEYVRWFVETEGGQVQQTGANNS